MSEAIETIPGYLAPSSSKQERPKKKVRQEATPSTTNNEERPIANLEEVRIAKGKAEKMAAEQAGLAEANERQKFIAGIIERAGQGFKEIEPESVDTLSPEEEKKYLSILQSNIEIVKLQKQYDEAKIKNLPDFSVLKRMLIDRKTKLVDTVLGRNRRISQGGVLDLDRLERGIDRVREKEQRSYNAPAIKEPKSFWQKLSRTLGISHPAQEASVAKSPFEDIEIGPFSFIPDDVHFNANFLAKAMETIPALYDNLGEALQGDPRIVLAMVKKDVGAAAKLSPELRHDPKYAEQLVKTNGLAFQYLAEPLKESEELISAALVNNGLAIQFVPDWFKNQRHFAEKAVASNNAAYDYLPPELQQNRELALLSLQKIDAGGAKKLLERSDKHYPTSLPQEFKNDPKFMLEAIVGNPEAFTLAAEGLRKDEQFILDAVEANPRVVDFLGDVLRKRIEAAIDAQKTKGAKRS